MKQEWEEILNQVKSGQLSAEEAAARLQQLEENAQPAGRDDAAPGPVTGEADPGATEDSAVPVDSMAGWQRWWLYPFWAGLGVFMLGSALMAWAYTSERFFWFACAWLPLLFGLLVLVLSAWSRTTRWVHVRVNEPGKAGQKPTRIAISLPLPVRLMGWGLRVFGPMIPQFREKNLDQIAPILEALGETHDPLTVEVNDKNGEKVQVYIG